MLGLRISKYIFTSLQLLIKEMHLGGLNEFISYAKSLCVTGILLAKSEHQTNNYIIVNCRNTLDHLNKNDGSYNNRTYPKADYTNKSLAQSTKSNKSTSFVQYHPSSQIVKTHSLTILNQHFSFGIIVCSYCSFVNSIYIIFYEY